MILDDSRQIGSIVPQYKSYGRQKCFIAFTKAASWSVDLMSACEEVLSLPQFNLEPDYAGKHFDPDVTLIQKARDLIANARYGIYDLSYWLDDKGQWQLPRNVFIELGMAIALNRPTLLLRHASNEDIEFPECLKSISDSILQFGGEFTLKEELMRRLPQWLDAPPELDWWSRYCIFGNRKCEYREAHPRVRQWGHRELACHIADGPDNDRTDFRHTVENVLERFSDLKVTHLDSLPLANGYEFLLCSYCQAVRSTSFAIYRITPKTPAEAFIATGISIALEDQFEYSIPRLLLTDKVETLPSLLSDREVCLARNNREMKDRLMQFMPSVMQKVREIAYKPKPLPFIDVTHVDLSELDGNFEEDPQALLEVGIRLEESGQLEAAIASYRKAIDIDSTYVAAFLRLGEAYVKSGNLPAAEEHLKNALSLDPHNPTILLALGNALAETKKYGEAIDALEQAISLNADDMSAVKALAETTRRSGSYAKSEKAYRDLIIRFPNDNTLRTGLGELLVLAGNVIEAEQVFRETVKSFPDDIAGLTGLAETLNRLGRFDDAEQVYRDIISRFPANATIRNQLASLLLNQNRKVEAEDLYRETLTLFPEDAQAQSALESIQRSQRSRPGTSKVRIYDLAKELKLDTKRLIEEIRREGVDVSVPSNSVSKELAEKIRNKYFPKKETTVKRAVKPVIKRGVLPVPEESAVARVTEPQTIRLVRRLDKTGTESTTPVKHSTSVVKKLIPKIGSHVSDQTSDVVSPKDYVGMRSITSPASGEKILAEVTAKLYVGNLAFKATPKDLTEFFLRVGMVRSVSILKDQAGRSRGFAFVEMSTPEEASDAIRQLNNRELLGRRVLVSAARPRVKHG